MDPIQDGSWWDWLAYFDVNEKRPELLELKKSRNRAVEAAQITEELIALAKVMREAAKWGEQLGLSHGEVAFYDALEMNGSAVEVMKL